MPAELDLEALRAAAPSCTGLAVLAGSPLMLVAASGEPTLGGWGSWAEVAEAATAVLHDAPVRCGEVLMRLPKAILLLEARGGEAEGSDGGVVAVLVELSKAGAGVALVQARVTASKVAVAGALRPAAGRQGRPT